MMVGNDVIGDDGAWEAATPTERRQRLRREMNRAVGSADLRYVLYALISGELTNEERAAYVYDALAAASKVGYPCGVRLYEYSMGEGGVYAVIELPVGTVAFALNEYGSDDFMYEQDLIRPIIEGFIGDEGYGRREKA